MCEPPTDGWEVQLVCVCVDACIHSMCMGTWLSEEPISCSRLRRHRSAWISGLFRFGGGTNSESAESVSQLWSPKSWIMCSHHSYLLLRRGSQLKIPRGH